MMEQTAEASQLAYARFAGLIYFLVLGFDIAGLLIVSSIGNSLYSQGQIKLVSTLGR